jgi:REP element-mobilizing transposase RayT
MRVRPKLWSLRGRRTFKKLLPALAAGSNRFGMRLCEYSVQGDHIHMIVEAECSLSLSRGVQGLAVRIARRVNRIMGRKGKVFRDRFHDRVLKTPRQVRNAIAYVLCNARKHIGDPRRLADWLDPMSSARSFTGWRGRNPEVESSVTANPTTWLLRVGWRRSGLLSPDHVPGRLPA